MPAVSYVVTRSSQALPYAPSPIQTPILQMNPESKQNPCKGFPSRESRFPLLEYRRQHDPDKLPLTPKSLRKEIESATTQDAKKVPTFRPFSHSTLPQNLYMIAATLCSPGSYHIAISQKCAGPAPSRMSIARRALRNARTCCFVPNPNAAFPTATLELQWFTQDASHIAMASTFAVKARYLPLPRRPSASTPFRMQSPDHEPSGECQTMHSPIDFHIELSEAP